jgi:lipid-A-disaccharide synthase
VGRDLSVFVIAGEPSGDALGGAVLSGLKSLIPNVKVSGVGGPLMQAEGLDSLFDMDELSVMGLAEVLPKLPGLLARVRQTAEAVIAAQPDILLTIDSPDFCLRVVKRVRATRPDQRVVHYVAPSVWAWRPERAAKMAPLVDQVLCLLPFEPPFMEAEGMRADFVGHPVAAQPVPTDEDVSNVRASLGLQRETPLLLALPGSRRSEVDRLAPIFGPALNRLATRHPDLRVIVPTVSGLAARVRDLVRNWPGHPVVLAPEGPDWQAKKRAVFAAADVALAASGTVSLELAAANTPMVIGYDMNWFSRRIIASRLRIDTVTLVNLVSETRAVPEYLGQACTPSSLATALEAVLADPSAQAAAMQVTMERLGRGGEAPGLRAAHAILDGLSAR